MVTEMGTKMGGRSFALTILLGIFISIMVITLFNLVVSYVYEGPKYENFCNSTSYYDYPSKTYPGTYSPTQNCSFNQSLFDSAQVCSNNASTPVYNYDTYGCAVSLKECNDCNTRFNNGQEVYNRNTFFIFAVIGFVLIVVGLFITNLLIQIVTLPAGAFLVIEAAVKNFDNKLYVIITFTLLIIAATYLAIKKLR